MAGVALGNLANAAAAVPHGSPPAVRTHELFRDGLWAALPNPETTVFFAAFLPQFMHVDASPVQGLLLGALFVAVAASTEALYALTAGSIAPWLRGQGGARHLGRYLAGGTFIGLGLFTALAGTRGSR